LYSFPDPQGHLSLGFGMGHLQLLASYIEHYILRFPRTKKFLPRPKEARTFGAARPDALAWVREWRLPE
jgi:hypothetical protein